MDERKLRDYVELVLLKLGFTYSYDGMPSLIQAVYLCAQQPEALRAVTKLVYPEIAKMEGTKWKNVERNMRTAVDGFWERGNRSLLNEMAGYTLMSKPSVGEVISYVVGYIRMQELLHRNDQQ